MKQRQVFLQSRTET